MPKSRGRAKKKRSPSSRAHEEAVADERLKGKRLSWQARRNRRMAGWSLVALGGLVGVSHWMEHLGLFRLASDSVQDLFLGYPLAMLLIVAGFILLPA